MKDDYCFLILSCDKNEELAEFCVDQLLRNLPKSIPIFVMMENCKIKKDTVITIKTKKCTYWGTRLEKAINIIPTQNVILMCDDFIVEKEINISELDRLSQLMINQTDLGNVMLTSIIGKNNEDDYILEKYVRRDNYGDYKTALQMGIWNIDFLKAIIMRKSTPWTFEVFSNFRSFILDYRCYALKDKEKQPIVYNDGFFVIQGKINREERKRLENDLHMNIFISSLSEWEEPPIRDNVSFFYRVYRRLLIFFYKIMFLIRASVCKRRAKNV